MAHQPGVPRLWTDGTCHRPYTHTANVRRILRHRNVHKTPWNHCHHVHSAGVQRKRLPVRTNRWHSPRCLHCLNTACDRITYTGDHRGPKPHKWPHCRRTLRLWTDQHPHGAHPDKPKCATHICATVQDSNSVIRTSARDCWLHAGKGGHPAL